MFDSLQQRLGATFDRLRGRGALTESDVDAGLADIRTALIEADVALPVVDQFISKVRPQAIGESVIRSVTPGQQIVKIVHDALVETLGKENSALNLGSPPAPILIKKAAGLATQKKPGSGSKEPNKVKVGKISQKQLRDIATMKMPDLNTTDVEAAMRTIAGTARSMGIEVEGR